MINTDFQKLEERFNQLTHKNNDTLKQRTIEKLTNEAKDLRKELYNLNQKYDNVQKKFIKTLDNIENIDEYLTSLSNSKTRTHKQNQDREEDNEDAI